MTVPATTRKAGPYTGTGAQTVFPFSFKIFTTTDVKVVVADLAGVETTLSSGYTVTANSDQVASPGGSVTMAVAPATGYKLSILGNLPYDQTLAIPGGGNYNPVAHENALDRIVEQMQQVFELASRALVQGATATGGGGTLPSGVSFNVLGWDSAGTSLVNYNPTSLGIAISYAGWATQTFSGTGAQTTFVLTNDAGVADNIELAVGGVVQTAGVNFTYTSATKTITFLTGAPPVGTNNVRARYGQALPVGTLLSTGVTDSTAFGRGVLTAASAAAAGLVTPGSDIGAATATTQSVGDNSTKVATTAFAQAATPQIQPISASVSANALTITASALTLDFRSTTLGSGAVTRVTGTPASLVVPSTGTLGTVSATQSRLAVLALNNAGTVELAVVNIAGSNDLTETGLISTTAISAAATSASVVYSTTARTSVAYRVIGYVESTQATAGTWATAPSTIQGYGGQALAAMSSLGYGQTWQNVTGSRALSTTYYNTTGRPIAVNVRCALSVSGSAFQLFCNGQDVGYHSAAGNGNVTMSMIVPAGASYQALNNSGATLGVWSELR